MKNNILNILLSILILQVVFSCKAPEKRISKIYKSDSMVMRPNTQKVVKINVPKIDDKKLISLVDNKSNIDTVFGKYHIKCHEVDDEKNIVKFYYHNSNSDTTYYKGIKLCIEVRNGDKICTKTITRKELGSLIHIKGLNTFYIILLDIISKNNGSICCNFRLSDVDADDYTFYFQCYFEKEIFKLKYVGTESDIYQ